MKKGRLKRLQIMLDDAELVALETWRFTRQMPSRAAAIRKLLRRGLAAEGFEAPYLSAWAHSAHLWNLRQRRSRCSHRRICHGPIWY